MQLSPGAKKPPRYAPGEENKAIEVTITFRYKPDLNNYKNLPEGLPAEEESIFEDANNITDCLKWDKSSFEDGVFSIVELMDSSEEDLNVQFKVVDEVLPAHNED